MRSRFVLALLTLAVAFPAVALDASDETPTLPTLLSPRDRNAAEDAIRQQRLESLLPRLMAETYIDLWLVLSREYAEDPIHFTLVPQPSFAARRTTLLAFHRQPDGWW